jgi:hypothetical protein
MPQRVEEDLNGKAPDITRLIRSIQRIEGNPDCFRTAVGECDRRDCFWREYCLAEEPREQK